MERKNLDFEIKSEADGTFVAYGSTFGNVDLVGDIVQKGAFTKSLARTGASGVKMFLQHDSNDIIGKFTEIYEDAKGLVVKGQFYLGNIQKADETYFLMKEGEITQFSIGYSIPKGGKSFDGKGNTNLDEINLHEISPVTYPANPEAELVGIKAIEDMSEKDFERKLRDAVGLSRNKAKALMSGGFKAMSQRDADNKQKEDKEADVWSEIINQMEK